MRPNDVALALSLVALVIAGALVLTTGNARVSATTENTSNLWSSAAVEVEASAPAGLLMNGDNLFPGRSVTGCAEVRFAGTASGLDLRMHGLGDPGGLAPFVELRLEVGVGTSRGCTGFESTRTLYSGSLANLLARHDTHERGILVAASMTPDDTVVIRGMALVVDDNDAQGRSTDFQLVFEVRP